MKQRIRYNRVLWNLLRDERGAVMAMVVLWLPAIAGFFSLGTDWANVQWARNQLQVTAEAAVLAATSRLPDNSVCSNPIPANPTSACDVARSYAIANMPVVDYGTVLKTADVVVGTWTDGCNAGVSNATCFVGVSAGTACPTCNAVKVTTQRSAANGNALKLAFAPMIGIGNWDVGATAIAVYGTGTLGAQPQWNAIIVQDITGSLWKSGATSANQPLTQMKQANKALLDCMHQNAGANSQLGITLFTGCSGTGCSTPVATYQSMTPVNGGSTNYNTLATSIMGNPPNNTTTTTTSASSSSTPPPVGGSGITLCGTKNTAVPPVTMPQCTNGPTGVTTNQAAGINSAFVQMCTSSPCTPAGPAGSKNVMIVVSDGLPAQSGCGTAGVRCTALESAAQAAADNAYANGIDVYTIFYGSAGAGTADYNAGVAFMASLKRGNGIALVTPNAATLPAQMGQVCSTMPHRLVW